jgi:carbamoyl-phosphate synthase small subunit
MDGRNLIGEVGTGKPVTFDPGSRAAARRRIALVDCGVKMNIVRELTGRGCTVTVFPHDASAADVLATKPDGVLFSNGPGDPAVLERQAATVKGCLGKLPVWGICLGHQLIGIALGAKSYKLPFGHHGLNHPVRDERTKKVFITSQNHGFAIDEKSLPSQTETWFVNANDGSLEGIRNVRLSVLTAQFHPEASPGPRDSSWIFDAFLETIR